MCIFELLRLHVFQEQKLKRHAYNIRYVANIKHNKKTSIQKCLGEKYFNNENIVCYPSVKCANEVYGKTCGLSCYTRRCDVDR